VTGSTDPRSAAVRRWLVTGAAGFIGSHLLDELLRRGEHVTGLDNFATGRRANIDDVLAALPADAAARLAFIEGDIRDPATCRRAVDGADFVLHQAAIGSVPRSIEDPLTTHAVNVDGFVNMLDAARDIGVRGFIYASSSSVYGDSAAEVKREGEEGQPLSPYAASKRIDELYAAAFARNYAMSLVGLRYFNVYGPRQDPAGAYAAVIPRWIGRLLAGERCVIYGDGQTSRDFTHVDDVVAANLAAADAATGPDSPTAPFYNIAYGRRTTLDELYRLLRAAVARLRPDAAGLEPDYQPFRPGDVRHSAADTSRARAELGYRPAVVPEEGLRRTVDWFADQLAPATADR
jgi:UDP-N-acetylglucosamine 4-epimerase